MAKELSGFEASLIVLFMLSIAIGCKEPTDLEKCEIISDEMCIVINECSYIRYQECDDYYDEELCEKMEIGEDWEQCHNDLQVMTCEDDYPPDSCDESFTWKE